MGKYDEDVLHDSEDDKFDDFEEANDGFDDFEEEDCEYDDDDFDDADAIGSRLQLTEL